MLSSFDLAHKRHAFLNKIESLDTDKNTVADLDFTNLENRVAASVCQKDILQGHDIHLKRACAMFGLIPTDVREKHRNAAKAENFKYLYSIRIKGDCDEMPYPDHPTHCRNCLKPLLTDNPNTFNECHNCEVI